MIFGESFGVTDTEMVFEKAPNMVRGTILVVESPIKVIFQEVAKAMREPEAEMVEIQ